MQCLSLKEEKDDFFQKLADNTESVPNNKTNSHGRF